MGVNLRESAIRIHLGEWSVEIPESWDHAFEEGVLAMTNPHGAGALQFTSVTKTEQGDVTDDDLEEFIEDSDYGELDREPIELGGFTGFRLEGEDDRDRAWQFWFLRAGTLLLFVSYNCEQDAVGEEEEAIAEALASLRLETETPPDAVRH